MLRAMLFTLSGIIVFLSAFLVVRGKWDEDDLLANVDNSLAGSYAADRRASARPDSQPLSQQAGSAPATFDPNTADSATLVALGLSPWQARNVIRYRQSGGVYHRAEDFKRLYGLTVSQWERLESRIRIGRAYRYLAEVEDLSSSYQTNSFSRARRSSSSQDLLNGTDLSVPEVSDSLLHSTHPFGRFPSANKLKKGETVDLSACDTTDLKRIPGIGSYYARRIAEYREKLGGFVSLRQLNDDALSFLPADIEAYLEISKVPVRKLRINHLSVRELASHPYISYPQARQIYNRVRVNGPLSSWDELLFLTEFTEADRQRLEPYVEF